MGFFDLGLSDVIGAGAQAGMNWKIAKEQMAFQERMSNTAYQRSVKDMRAAGINPMLVTRLGGATTPPGAAIPVTQNPISSAVKTRTEGQKKANVHADTGLKYALAGAAEEGALKDRSSRELIDAQIKGETMRNALIFHTLPAAGARGRFDKTPAGQLIQKWHRAATGVLGPVAPFLGGAAGAFIGARTRKPTVINKGPTNIKNFPRR